jgi:hypothetical protein
MSHELRAVCVEQKTRSSQLTAHSYKKKEPSCLRRLFLFIEDKLILINNKPESLQFGLVHYLGNLFTVHNHLMLGYIKDFMRHTKIVDCFQTKQ